jgi:acetyl esterase
MPLAHGALDVFDESYVRHGDRSLFVRIYSPRGPGPFPTLLSLHGGAWNSGARDSNASLDRAVAASGVLVVAADFRQPPLGRYPDSVADVNLAARWAQANASRYRGRADRIGGLGTSSGGHLLLLNALRPRDPRYTALPLAQSGAPPASSQVLHHIALCWPIAEPLERYRWARRTSRPQLAAAHERYWGDEAAMADGSPQLILDRREPDLTHLPDLLVVQGTADENIPAGATARFVRCYRAAGGQADLRMFAGLPHGFITRDVNQPQSQQAIEVIVSFIAGQFATAAAVDTANSN